MEQDKINEGLSVVTNAAAEQVKEALKQYGLRYAAVVVVAEIPDTVVGPMQMGVWLCARDDRIVPAITDILGKIVDKMEEKLPVAEVPRDKLN